MKEKQNKLFTKDFTLVVIGQIISLFGNSILRFALPLYLLRQTGSSVLFGLVSACSFLPMIVLSLLGGVLADRVNKRNIMVILDFSTAALITCFALALNFSPLVPLMIVTLMLLYGIQGTYQPAVQASIPVLLSNDNILTGNAVINQINSLSSLIGPIVGGLLMGSFGIVPILMISIICFLFSAIMEIFIHIPHEKREMEGSVIAIVKKDLGDSFTFMRKEKPFLIQVMILAAIINFALSSMLMVGMPVILTQKLGVSDQLMGYCQGALGIGSLLGGLSVAALGKRLTLKSVPILFTATGVISIPIALALLFQIPVMAAYTVMCVCCALLMAFATAGSIQLIACVQSETPQELVGKVLSCVMVASICAQPLGQTMYGFLFQYVEAWIVISGAVLASILISIYSKGIFHRKMKEDKKLELEI